MTICGDQITHEIPLSSDAYEALAAYIKKERAAGKGPLFQSENGKQHACLSGIDRHYLWPVLPHEIWRKLHFCDFLT